MKEQAPQQMEEEKVEEPKQEQKQEMEQKETKPAPSIQKDKGGQSPGLKDDGKDNSHGKDAN
jgi:hypothetical protein